MVQFAVAALCERRVNRPAGWRADTVPKTSGFPLMHPPSASSVQAPTSGIWNAESRFNPCARAGANVGRFANRLYTVVSIMPLPSRRSGFQVPGARGRNSGGKPSHGKRNGLPVS